MRNPFPGLLPDWLFFRFSKPVPTQDELAEYFGMPSAGGENAACPTGDWRLDVGEAVQCPDCGYTFLFHEPSSSGPITPDMVRARCRRCGCYFGKSILK